MENGIFYYSPVHRIVTVILFTAFYPITKSRISRMAPPDGKVDVAVQKFFYKS